MKGKFFFILISIIMGIFFFHCPSSKPPTFDIFEIDAKWPDGFEIDVVLPDGEIIQPEFDIKPDDIIPICKLDNDCNDNNPCTIDKCIDGKCFYEIDLSNPECCKTGAVFSENFDGENKTFEFTETHPEIKWQFVNDLKYVSKSGSLYFGNPGTHNYQADTPVGGIARTKPVAVNKSATDVKLKFQLYIDIEIDPQYDKFYISYEIEGEKFDTKPILWSKEQLTIENYKKWNEISIDLNKEKVLGKKVIIHLIFDSVDAYANSTEGVYIDDFELSISCEKFPCDKNENCDDGNPCTYDFCIDGYCEFEFISDCCFDSSECNDGNKCTEDVCENNKCKFIPIPNCCKVDKDCDDKNPCTKDMCVFKGGVSVCENILLAGCCLEDKDCNDNNPCTKDACMNGKCAYKTISDCCVTDKDCYEFPGPMPPPEGCWKPYCKNNKCVYEEIKCDDGNPCTKDYCQDGKCIFEPIQNCCTSDFQCDDNDPCTKDACMNGKCAYKTILDCCVTDKDCYEFPEPMPPSSCWKAYCKNNKCVYEEIKCDDGNPCTKDYCQGEKCIFEPIKCDDNNPCTKDYCMGGKCIFEVISNCCSSDFQCNDNNPCTKDACINNKCLYEKFLDCCVADPECNDNNPCSADKCVNNKCSFVPISDCCTQDSQCNDNNICTMDKCVNNKCNFSLITGCCKVHGDCDDQNQCTSDVCINNKCANYNVAIPCDDGNFCTENDKCGEGKCISGTLKNCDDKDKCTEDWCDPKAGCMHKLLPNCPAICTKNEDCNDNDKCTDDKCEGGVCNHYPSSLCCILDKDCDDKNPCTSDNCNPQTKECVYIPNSKPCDDGNLCTIGDLCENGKCKSGKEKECNDNNKCTKDFCLNGECKYEEIPDCCTEKVIYLGDFTDGDNEGFTFQPDKGLVKWQVHYGKYKSPFHSLYFGNPFAGNYKGPEEQAVSGTATSPKIFIPPSPSTILTFYVYLDIEQIPQYDKFWVLLIVQGKQPLEIWNKNLVPNSMYKKFVEAKVNLSQYTGQAIQIQFKFDSLDGLYNETEGVYVDDVKVTGGCEPVKWCKFDGECNDNDICTKDTCKGNMCFYSPVPNCCKKDSECDDKYSCTKDYCKDGKCFHDFIPDCCTVDAECDDGNSCTLDKCLMNKCYYEPKGGGGCCKTATDCNDNDKCTEDLCINYKCTYKQIPNCCIPSKVYKESFMIKTLPDWTIIQDGSSYKWQIYNGNYYDPPFALYFGSIEDGKPSPPPIGTYGIAISPSFKLPSYGNAEFSFWYLLNIGWGYNIFTVLVKDGNTLVPVWELSPFKEEEFPNGWTEGMINLNKFLGKEISIAFQFYTAEPFEPKKQGIYVDTINIETKCE